MKVLHVISSIARQGGGPSRSSQGLVAGLRAEGVDAWLMTLHEGEKPWIEGCDQFVNGGSFEEALLKVKPDIVHIHGIWSLELHRCAVICRKRGIPYVIAPRGMLEPWSLQQKWLKKRVARWLYQDRDLKKSAALHATAESEAEQFRKLGFKNYCIVSPNGVNVPEGTGVGDRCRGTADGKCLNRRAAAEKKVEEWLDGVDEAIFAAALEKVIAEKKALGEYIFEKDEYVEKGKVAAKAFFVGYSRRIIRLSDGRCVYFAPDPRSKLRNPDNAICWAEYAFHAVSSGGDRIPGKNYNYRHYNEYKIVNTDLIESTLLAERCVPVKKGKHPEQDSVKFFGSAHLGGLFDVVVRLDEYGNVNANMTEVTFEASTKEGQKKLPRFVSLTEAIRTVVSHQTATGTYPPNKNSIANFDFMRKGGSVAYSSTHSKRLNAPRRALFVSRMHPKKGVLELVESWARVKSSGTIIQNEITANWYDVVPASEISGMPIVQVIPSRTRFLDKRAIKNLFKSFGEVENASDGRRVTFPAKSVGKMMGQRGVDLYRLAGSFDELFKVSVRAWSESEATIKDHKQHRNIDAYHHYIAKFRDEDDECYVRFTIREDKGGKSARNEIHSSTVSRIIVYKAKGAELSNLGHAQAEDSTPFVDNKISYFMNRVNPLSGWVCELVYTLNGETERAYEAKVKQRVKELGLEDQFIFTGPLDDDKKWEAYRRANLFILPTYSENFGIVVAEALWAGVPVITTKGTPWEELVGCRCGWWIDLPGESGVGDRSRGSIEWLTLDQALSEATKLSTEELATLGQNGHTLVENKYTWSAVVKAMVHGYEQVLRR